METYIKQILERFGVVPVFLVLVVAFFACAWLFSWASAERAAVDKGMRPSVEVRDQ